MRLSQGKDTYDWVQGFIFSLTQDAVLPRSDAGSNGVGPASGFVVQIRRPRALCDTRCMRHVARMWPIV